MFYNVVILFVKYIYTEVVCGIGFTAKGSLAIKFLRRGLAPYFLQCCSLPVYVCDVCIYLEEFRAYLQCAPAINAGCTKLSVKHDFK